MPLLSSLPLLLLSDDAAIIAAITDSLLTLLSGSEGSPCERARQELAVSLNLAA